MITISSEIETLLAAEAARRNAVKAEDAPDTTAQEIATSLLQSAAQRYEADAERKDADGLFARFCQASHEDKPTVRAALVAALEEAGV